MSVEVTFQRLYDQVELITGVGDASLGKLCIMSFVSLLAGERFGDRPQSASQVIRKFAIPVNDRMDTIGRQRLKPFAPRIVGTNDGHDAARAELLYRAVLDEVLSAGPYGAGVAQDVESLRKAAGPRAAENLRHLREAYADGRYEVMAKECGHLIAALSEASGEPRWRAWYWDKAIELLDRLCDVGAESRPAPATGELAGRAGQAGLEA